MYTCSHLVSWKPPASQFNIDVSSPNFFEEIIINEIIEFKKVETAKPESINEELEELDANLDIRKTIKAAANPPINEKIGIIRIEYDARPSDITKTAPTAAPEETPIIPGSAIGFLKIPCKEAPETANDAPTNIERIILGNLIFEITFSFTGSISLEFIRKFSKYSNVSLYVVETAPLDRDISEITNRNRIIEGAINKNLLK